MAAKAGEIGSSAWWTKTADKLLDFGLGMLKYETDGIERTGGGSTAQRESSVMGGMTNMLPWIMGAAGVVGIVLLMRKR